MPTWPGTIPALDTVTGYSEAPGDQTLRTNMEEGEAKTRRVTAPPPDQLSFQQAYTIAETQTLDTFYVTTLAGGALKFDGTHPRTGATVNFRFVGRPSYTYLRGGMFTCSFQLEVVA